MKRFDLWKLSLLNVFSSPVRSMLTVLGFSIGVGAILAVLTLGEAGKMQVQNEMGRLSIDRIWVTAAEGSYLTRGTGDWLTQTTGAETDELVYLPFNLRTGDGQTAPVVAIGCDRKYLLDALLPEGRMLWPLEWQQTQPPVLIGEELARQMSISAGDVVTLSQKSYEVCGVIAASQGVASVPLESSVVLPIDAACALTHGIIHEVQLRAPENVSLERAQRMAVQALGLRGVDVDATTLQIQMEAASSVILTFVNVLKWVAMVCILVGGIGVMNILLVSVRERRREIGVMKSMGTTPVQICALFLSEALVYAVIGGILGIFLGLGLIDAAGRSIELAARASLSDCAVVFACAMGTGLLFGVLPAFHASLLTCVDALREE